MQRYLYSEINEVIRKKLVLISGPRQVGKTTLAKSINQSFDYLNYDHLYNRKQLLSQQWDRTKKVLIFDEIHKMKNWKQWLKGIYDTEENNKIIVTGSARMDTHRKVGDSMAGRYFLYQLMPFDLKELKKNGFSNTKENFELLYSLSGFPEPFLSKSESFYKKWRKSHLDIIVKQDILELETIKRISDLSTLIELMTERIGSIMSYNSLREDLLTDDKTVKRWLIALENSYIFFKLRPYSRKLVGSIKKSPKYYFYDYPRINDHGARLENFVALSLLKEVYYRNEVLGQDYSLHFLRDNNKNEVDFLICNNQIPLVMIEVKNGDDNPSKSFQHFESALKKQNAKVEKIQLVLNLKKEFSTKSGIKISKLEKWLELMNF